MRTPRPGRLVKLLAVSAALVLCAHVFVYIRRQPPTELSPAYERDSCPTCPRSYRYIHNQPQLCRDRSPFLVLLVPVGPWDSKTRDAVRRTWGSPGEDTLTLFFMGLPEDRTTSGHLEAESGTHRDIIQMDFRDSYRNLTTKTVMMMNWVSSHCPNASYVMKVDADIFVNIFHLLRWLRGAPRRGFITGSLINDGRPRRDPNSKWHLSEEQYPEDSFPPYVSGAGYVLSADLALRITRASRSVPLIPLEDVYVGLCLRVLGVRPVYSLGLLSLRNLFEIRNLEYDRCAFAKLIIVNGFQPSKLLHAWRDFSKGHSLC